MIDYEVSINIPRDVVGRFIINVKAKTPEEARRLAFQEIEKLSSMRAREIEDRIHVDLDEGFVFSKAKIIEMTGWDEETEQEVYRGE